MDKNILKDLPPVSNLKYSLWKTLNRLRVEVAKTKKNLIGETTECEFARRLTLNAVQIDQHKMRGE